MANMIARAEILARLAHAGQIDKCGIEYAEHLKSVAAITASRIPIMGRFHEDAVTAAWLHDTIEDTPLSLHDLEQFGFRKTVIKAVALLTHTHEHSHDDYLRVIRDSDTVEGRIARVVKLADIDHNASPERGDWMPAHKLAERRERSLRIMRGDVE